MKTTKKCLLLNGCQTVSTKTIVRLHSQTMFFFSSSSSSCFFPKRKNSVKRLCSCCKWPNGSLWFATMNFIIFFESFSAIRFTVFYNTLSDINKPWICSFHSIMKTFLLSVAIFSFCTCQSGGQHLEFLNLSSWTRCSSLCWCADDNHGRVYGRCSVDKQNESVDFNLSRQLYSL